MLEKNLLPEHVEIRPFMLRWAGEHTLSRQLGKERFGQKHGKGRKIRRPIFLPNKSFCHNPQYFSGD
jgi:hypothetical protein